ncbi:MAG: hypothetical protein MSG64_20725 [Pyrinomonadaceae bacterium MAG19_C2-C3]|nr:hypothetical protein [Pyrinomonadaceae bacterium MAG19_C2-C3]
MSSNLTARSKFHAANNRSLPPVLHHQPKKRRSVMSDHNQRKCSHLSRRVSLRVVVIGRIFG